MLLSKRLWAVLLVAVLVVGLLVGFGAGDQAVAKEPRAEIGKIMIPAAAFIPTTDDWDYSNNGYYLATGGDRGNFTAPLAFPVPVVTLRRIILVAEDDTASASVCATLYRAEPLAANESTLATVCTVDSTDHPQKVALPATGRRKANTVNQGPYLWVSIDPGTTLYGVQVAYSY